MLIYVCHFHHHFLHLIVSQISDFLSFFFILSRYSCLHLGFQHPRIFILILREINWIFFVPATLFQLEGLIDQCETILEETVNIETVIKFYESAAMYASNRVQKACMKWLQVNLLSHLPEHPTKLRTVPAHIMEKLIQDPSLIVMQTEFSVYVLLRLWLFLIFHPNWEGSPTEAVVSSHRFFQVSLIFFSFSFLYKTLKHILVKQHRNFKVGTT